MNTTVEKEIKKSLQKKQVVELLNSIETGAREPVEYINKRHFVQHNLGAGDGLQGFVQVVEGLSQFPEPAKVNVVRIFEDEDYVFAHTEYNFFGPKIGFDIFRFEKDRIVEHWDNLQQTPSSPNHSGHTMVDGHTEIEDLGNTMGNKIFVENFIKDVYMGENLDKIDDYLDAQNYVEHNPALSDGVAEQKKYLAWMQENHRVVRYDRIHKVLGEGNFVLAVSEGVHGEGDELPAALYDLFRIAGSKITEHWCVIQSIPQEQDRMNKNGKFGF